MSEQKKILTLRAPAADAAAPAITKKGRGWKVAESRLDTLHEVAREARRNPTPAQDALGAALTAANLGKYRLKRQVVIGSALVDFACQPLKVAVQIDTGGDPVLTRRSDRALEAVGIALLRFPEARVLAEAEAVTQEIIAGRKARWHDQRQRPTARRGYAR